MTKVNVVVPGKFHLHNWITQVQDCDGIELGLSFSYKIGEFVTKRQYNLWQKEYAFRLINRIFPGLNWDFYLPFLNDFASAAFRRKFLDAEIIHFVCNGSLSKFVSERKASKRLIIAEVIGVNHILRDSIINSEAKKWGINYKKCTPSLTAAMSKELNCSDIVLAPSKSCAESYSDMFNRSVKIIPYGASLSNFKCDSTIEKFDDDILKFVCVGNICLIKGHLYLLEAFKLAKTNGLPVSLTLVGNISPELRSVIKNYSDYFQHVPHCPNYRLSSLLNKHHIFILPALGEGLAVSQLEAAACGLPVFTTVYSGIEGAISGGGFAYYFESRSVDSIYESILFSINNRDRLKNMSRSSLGAVSNALNWGVYKNCLIDLYKSVC